MLELTDEQAELVRLVVEDNPRVCCLTGGPGTGKSSTIRALLDELRERGRSCLLAAPSGKAAQRLEEATGRPAATLHRLLGLRPRSDGAGFTELRPLQAAVVIVDECSMIGSTVFAALLAGCFEGGGRVQCLVLVGDPDQLPPVDAGQPFRDLLQASTVAVPVARLTRVMRQALDSGIVRAAYAVKAGEMPEWAPDLRIVPCALAADVPSTVWQVLNELELDPERSQVLSPQRPHTAGVDALNAYIEGRRESMGPLLRGKFRKGTKVLHTKNDYDLGVFNGEVGFVDELRPGPPGKESRDEARVIMGGEPIVYRGAQLNLLMPAWALTVHRTQGSEYLDVIVVAHSQATKMLTRSLLYVALTRARNRVVVVGENEAVARAVRNVREQSRRTLLQRWLGAPAKESA